MRIEQETILNLELPYRERLILQRTVFQGGNGPRVAVTAGVHGDELEGLLVCHRLAAWLQALAKDRPDALLGQVDLYPGLNPLGLDTLHRFVPVFETDLNRSFPGHPRGLLPQRIADAALQHLLGAALVVDIHASNIYLREIPQVRINRDFEDSLVPLAQGMNLDVIWLHGAVTVLEATVAHSLNSRDTPCLVVEMGVGMRLTPAFTDQLVAGLLYTWQQLGVLAPDLALPRPTHVPRIADDNNVHYLNAETSGMFVPCVEHWKTLRGGETLGDIVSPLSGDTLAEITAPVDGILFTLREYPLVYEGSLMARIMAGGPPDTQDREASR